MLDEASLDTDTPRTIDGRKYPDRLRPYEQFDGEFLGLIDEGELVTFDEISIRVDKPKLLAVLFRWLSSAEWRGLIERKDPTRFPRKPRRYKRTKRSLTYAIDRCK